MTEQRTSAQQLITKITETLTNVLLHISESLLENSESKPLKYMKLLEYNNNFLRLYNIDILKFIQDPNDEVLNTIGLFSTIMGIGARYEGEIHNATTIQDVSKYLFPDNVKYQQKVLKFFYSLSVDEFKNFYTVFNAGVVMPSSLKSSIKVFMMALGLKEDDKEELAEKSLQLNEAVSTINKFIMSSNVDNPPPTQEVHEIMVATDARQYSDDQLEAAVSKINEFMVSKGATLLSRRYSDSTECTGQWVSN